MGQDPGRDLLRTACHGLHVAAGANMADEAGWHVPLSYRGVLAECRDVHDRAGIFDVSHLGRIRVRGDGAVDLLERLCTADVARQEDDTAQLSLVCNEDGGILADCMVLRLERFWVLTTSPHCREKVLGLAGALADEMNAKVDDQTTKTSMVAVAGPAAPAILDTVLPMRVSLLARGSARTGSMLVARYIASRTGSTHLWSLEVMLPNMLAGRAWRFITDKAGANAIAPAGLAARDVLRIEAGLPRYGHELNETTDPVSAGLLHAVDLDHDFIGRDAVRELSQRAPSRKLVGLAAAEAAEGQAARIPRQGTPVLRTGGGEVGQVTSATFSGALGRVIAMAYVSADAAEAGTELVVAAEAPLAVAVTEMPLNRPPAS